MRDKTVMRACIYCSKFVRIHLNGFPGIPVYQNKKQGDCDQIIIITEYYVIMSHGGLMIRSSSGGTDEIERKRNPSHEG